MPSLKCKWGVLQAGSTELAELFLSHLLGGTCRRSSRWERWMCGVSMAFHLLLNKQKLLQCYILHRSQVAEEWSLNPFLQITPEPQEPSPVTGLFEPDCPISPRALQTFVHWGAVSLSHSSGSSLFPLTLHLPMQIHRNHLLLFSCLQESLISVCPLLPITPVTHHWRQEHRDCRKKNIFTSLTEHSFMYSNSGKMHHIYTPRYIKRILGARHCQQQEIHRKAQSLLL